MKINNAWNHHLEKSNYRVPREDGGTLGNHHPHLRILLSKGNSSNHRGLEGFLLGHVWNPPALGHSPVNGGPVVMTRMVLNLATPVTQQNHHFYIQIIYKYLGLECLIGQFWFNVFLTFSRSFCTSTAIPTALPMNSPIRTKSSLVLPTFVSS